ncbi:KIR protein [Plasmodium knowlesi strain H]|uniref:KIR protein n=3 Tax=Plasmodium knowlesi TaxID=5850 RepID=A0A5K1UHH9_PLAKH|nr:KIR protein [Plasmodium knowlesi strain H]OTN65396.1 KIR protein [Plasmodium knowlesi]CAA9989460.1 KIR protein [Plasmodium knowlesi strain H]SBO25105.1 KIR protein [Plasmodium knowlesi strain H]SBO27812.1 KIR protein [Plasmodium knowlesi strain H]VVS78934.1 KIR protein [Plasmodium knowlesi strain H]|eukprot:XP_002260186.1 KIR protein [Plasmodium knowlesi strain H]
MSGGEGKRTGEHLNYLTSRREYKKLDGCINFCSNSNTADRVESELRGNYNVQDNAEKVVRAWCDNRTMGRDTTWSSPICYWFYYWLGDMISRKVGSGTAFYSTMAWIYSKLKENGVPHTCDILYHSDRPGQGLFKHRKVVYEYYEDHNLMEFQARTYGQLCDAEYREHMREIKEACETVAADCANGPNASGSYCTWFKGKEGGNEDYCNEAKRSQLQCTNSDELSKEPLDSHGLAHGAIATVTDNQEQVDPEFLGISSDEEEELRNLGLGRKYVYLDGSLGTDCVSYGNYDESDSMKNKLSTDVLKNHSWDDELAEKVVHTWCYVMNKVGRNGDTDGWCDYFYFWLGDKLYNGAEGHSTLYSVMNRVYLELRGSDVGNECNMKYAGMKKLDFIKMKKLHDYAGDRSFIQLGMNKINRDESAEKSCTPALHKYLQNAKRAYEYIRARCQGRTREPDYCRDFDDKYKSLIGDLTQQSNCTVAVKPATAAKPVAAKPVAAKTCTPDSSGSGEPCTPDLHHNGVPVEEGKGGSDSGGNNTGSVVTPSTVAGGTIATIGIPTISFFLYKYTDIFDGIKKSIFGGSNNRNRGRRSTIGRQHFDDILTENDFSTLGDDGSTTLGGGGGGSSTLGGSSTDISTIYDDGVRRRQPTGRGRTRTGINNGRPGNIRYYAT